MQPDKLCDMRKNEVLECLKTRRSVRAFDPEKVPSRELVAKVAEAGTYAPTGMGKQSPVIVAVMDRAVRNRLSKMNAGILGSASDPFYGAPVVLVVLADRSRPTYKYDGALVMGNMLNAAHALGLGSCWIHRAKEEFESPEGQELLKEWGISGDYEGIGHCVLGYALDGKEPSAAPRKSDYVHFIE